MRSQQVYQALVHVPNRFALCRITAIALKKLHKTNTRPEDTISDVLGDIHRYKARRSQVQHKDGVPGAQAVPVPAVVSPQDMGLSYPESVPAHSELVFVGD